MALLLSRAPLERRLGRPVRVTPTNLLYRGPLASCNYDCRYCPFAKTHDSASELRADEAALGRFVAYLKSVRGPWRVLFTPWGEALHHRWYQDALVALSHQEHVARVAIQTNLSQRPKFLERARSERVGLWSTFHPTQTELEPFSRRAIYAYEAGASISVGIVGTHDAIAAAEALRRALPAELYVWVNAHKSEGAPAYQSSQRQALRAIDPHFDDNCVRHASRGHECATGEDTFSVDGNGTLRRCHFVSAPLGNLYDGDLDLGMAREACPNETCGCHIGYVHLKRLGLRRKYGAGLLERVPESRCATPRGRGAADDRF